MEHRPETEAPLPAASEWRVVAWPSSFGQSRWDIRSIDVRFDRPTRLVDHHASGSSGPEHGPDRAFDGAKDTWWSGRPDASTDAPTEVFIGVELDRPAIPRSFSLKHARGGDPARVALLQYRDGRSWVTALARRLHPQQRSELLRPEPPQPPAATAAGWRVVTRSTSSGFAWDVRRLRLEGADGDLEGRPVASGTVEVSDSDDYAAVNAWRDGPGGWGGRADDAGEFFLGLSETAGQPLERIVLEQGDDHWTAAVDVERYDSSRRTWVRHTHADGLRPGRNVIDPSGRDTHAPRPATPSRSASGGRRPYADPFDDWRILVLIASYRDTEVANTVRSALTQAAYPEHLRFAICHQFDERTQDLLEPWARDPRFRVDSVPFSESRGCCWARARTFDLYDDEPYMFQIDAHTRFAARWDVRFVELLEAVDHPLPLLTTYPPSFRIENGDVTYDLEAGVQRLVIKEVRDDLTTLQVTEPADTDAPGSSPSIAAGQIFTRGRFCRDVPYDPELYFAGEEISLAYRAFTNGYELLHPTENLVWHLYQHSMPHHWNDHREVGATAAHDAAVERLRTLFSSEAASLGRYGPGPSRSLAEFEAHAGVTLAVPVAPSPAEVEPGVLTVRIDRSSIEPRDDYLAFVVAFLDAEGREIDRRYVTAPDVLDLSRGSVTLHDLDTDSIAGHVVIPVRRDLSFGAIQTPR